MKSVLVVCIGNICRSPMGQALLAAAAPGIEVTSAGTGALIGQPADPIARELMTARGLDIERHIARQINQAMVQSSDLILTMDNEQRRYIEARFPFARGRVFRLTETLKLDVPDPYRRGQAAFDHAYRLIDAGATAWAERIKQFK
jgi:protein-tyrosine phosphatase